MRKKGFTLIEILVVTTIIGLLSSTLIPRIGNSIEQTNNAVTQVNQNRDYACEELGLDDFCDSSAGGGTQNLGNGVHHVGTDITVCREGNCITMQDRNLGASKSGTTCSSADTGACGNHYQWGNNHGFINIGQYSGDPVRESETCRNKRATWDNSYSHNGYNGGIEDFMSCGNDYWTTSSEHHNDLRGGENDSGGSNRGYDLEHNVAYDVENRRGPCPEGYHVPSAGERGTLLQYRTKNNNVTSSGEYPLLFFTNPTAITKFKDDFKIPFAGYHSSSDASLEEMNTANFWSSSPGATNAFFIRIDSKKVSANGSTLRAFGMSVRCFKN